MKKVLAISLIIWTVSVQNISARHRPGAASSAAFTETSRRYFAAGQEDSLYEAFAREIYVTDEKMAEDDFEDRYRKFSAKLKQITRNEIIRQYGIIEDAYTEGLQQDVNSAKGKTIRDQYLKAFRRTVSDSLYGNVQLSKYLSFEKTDRITSFDSRVVVGTDGKILVTEDITIYNHDPNTSSADDPIQHGILRHFPTLYVNKWKLFQNTTFDLKDVLMDGKSVPWILVKHNNGISVRIGKDTEWLTEGKHRFHIVYETDNQLKTGDQNDELFWNVTGNGWDLRIDKASVIIVLPRGAKPIANAASCYTGVQGSKETACITGAQDANADSTVFHFSTTRPLKVHEGFSVSTSFEKGLIIKQPFLTRAVAFYKANIAGLTMLLIAVFIIIYGSIVWFLFGRDRRRGALVPSFNPPAGLSPAAVGYIYEQGFDLRQIAATIADWAARGLIDIEVAEEKHLLSKDSIYMITSGKNSNDAADPGYDENYDWMASNLVGITIAPKVFNSPVMSISKEIGNGMAAKYWTEEMKTKAREEEMSERRDNPNATKFYKKKFSFSAKGLFYSNSKYTMWLTGLVWLSFFVLLFGFFSRIAKENPWTLAWLVGGLIICWQLLRGLSRLMPGYSKEGREVMDKIEGFRMYLAAADEQKINMLNPPSKTIALYEKFLPYAIALNCEVAWGDQFRNVLDDSMALRPELRSGTRRYSMMYSSSFTSSFSSTISSASTPPSSGSSGGSFGGGSSGGGGGGGGGGGW